MADPQGKYSLADLEDSPPQQRGKYSLDDLQETPAPAPASTAPATPAPISRKNPKLLEAEAGIPAGPAVAAVGERAIQDVKNVATMGRELATSQPTRSLPSPSLARSGAVSAPQQTPDQYKEQARREAVLSHGIQGAGELALPAMAPAAVEAPIATALGAAGGYISGKAAKAGTKAAGGGPEAQELAETLGFWAPLSLSTVLRPEGGIDISPEGTRASGTVLGGRVGAGIAKTPEGVTIRGKVGPFEGSKTFGGKPPARPAIEPPTIEADPATEALARHDQIQQGAERMANGQPPVAPPPPPPSILERPGAPPELKQGVISQRMVDTLAQGISKLPESARPAAIQQAHETLSQVLLEASQKGPMVGPDGKLIAPVKDPEQASKVAIGLINTAVGEYEKQVSAAVKPGEAGGKGAAATPPTAAPKKTSREKAAELAPKSGKYSTSDLAEPETALPATSTSEGKPEATEVEKTAVTGKEEGVQFHHETGGEGTSGVANAPERENVPAAGSGSAVESRTAHGQGNGKVAPQVEVQGAEGARSDVAGGGGTSPESLPLRRGDRAVLTRPTEGENGKIYPKGTEVIIKWPHPNGLVARALVNDGSPDWQNNGPKISKGVSSFARATTEDGTKISRGTSAFTRATVPVSVGAVHGNADVRGKQEGAPVPSTGAGEAEQRTGGVPERRPEVSGEPERAEESPAKSEWQTLFDQASKIQPDKVDSLRKMSGEQLREIVRASGNANSGQTSISGHVENDQASNERSRKVSDYIEKLFERRARSEAVKSRMDELEEDERDPRAIMQEFWAKTFPVLDERGRKTFLGNFKAQIGLGPGDTISTGPSGNIVAKSHQHITDEFFKNAKTFDGLEQNEQAVVALADIVNEMRRKNEPVEAAAPALSAPQGKLIEGESGASPVSNKEPWEMTRAEWKQSKGLTFTGGVHQAFVEEALAAGKQVPPEVLKDYPDLKKNEPSVSPVSKTETKSKVEKSTPVVAEDTEPAKEEPTKAEKTFAADLNKKVDGLRKQIKELEKETAAPAAYFQDSAKNASERLKRAARNQKLSDLKSELREIEQAHKIDLAEKITPEEKVPEEGKNFEGRYVRASLEPVKAAWLEKYKPREGEDVDEHWKWMVKNASNADKPADFAKGHLYIKVPDDGSFYIPNNPAAIDHALKAAGKFAASKVGEALPKAGPKPFRMTSPKEFDNEKYVAGLKKEISDLENELDSAGALQKPYIEEQLKAARENLVEAKKEEPESILAGERGEVAPGGPLSAAAEAAGAVGNYLREAAHYTKIARDLQRNLETLDTKKQALILSAKNTFEKLKAEGLTKEDDAKLYHFVENPEGESLDPKQEKFFDQAEPLLDKNSELYTELSQGGIPIENYVHRVVKGKGGVLDRIAQGIKGITQKATLSKSAPQTKHRTYMVLENQKGERQVVSVKGGQVTSWKNGSPENLGGISHTQEGTVFEDKDGNVWNLKQATTKEIEQHTETKYYHSFWASTLVSNVQLQGAVNAMRFLNEFKTSPEFQETAFDLKKGNAPKGWKTTNLQQFNGYAFEPRTAEVLDAYYDRMRQGNLGALEQVGNFMRIAMLLNPLYHPANVVASWAMERGATGFLLPSEYKIAWKTGNKAVKAVIGKNQDFIDALDAGGALQSHREAMKDINKLFFDQLSEGLGKQEPWAMKVAKALGIEHGNLLNILHKFSSTVAWGANDILMLQSAYAYQEKNPGVSLADAFKEVGRIIPEYRVPTRIADSQLLSKLMTNKWVTIFGSYHYSLLRSFGEVAKSAIGAQEPPPGSSKAKEVAKGWDRIALLALVSMALYPILDEMAKKATGDKHARVKRFGPFGIIDAAAATAKHEQSVSQTMQRVVTPAPQSKAAAELLTNHEFYAGHNIYDPHASFKTQAEQIGRYILGETGQIGQYEKAQTTQQKRNFALGQVGIQMHKTAAEKTASDIAMSKVGTQAESPEDQESRVLRREILDQLRAGNKKPLVDAEHAHDITPKQARTLEERARRTPLQDTVHGFTYSEARRVYEVASPEEKKELDATMRQKRMNLLKAGRGREITTATP